MGVDDLAGMPWVYGKPPLIEVVCEFRFESDTEWDWTIAGQVWERVRNEFPVKETPRVVAPDFLQIPKEAESIANRMVFRAPDGSPLLQVGPELFTVNSLPPYAGWEAFRSLVLDKLEVYQSVAEPARVKRLGLRFINRIDLPGPELKLGDYLHSVPAVPDVAAALTGFLSISDLTWPDSRVALRFKLGSTESSSDTTAAFLLDLDASVRDLQLSRVELEVALAEMHGRVKRAFTASFTDHTHREVFDGSPA